MKPHQWAKEIKAWADGSTIQFCGFEEWVDVEEGEAPEWNEFSLYRIKPEQKEPQYLYVWKGELGHAPIITFTKEEVIYANLYIGKIKIEDESE